MTGTGVPYCKLQTTKILKYFIETIKLGYKSC